MSKLFMNSSAVTFSCRCAKMWIHPRKRNFFSSWRVDGCNPELSIFIWLLLMKHISKGLFFSFTTRAVQYTPLVITLESYFTWLHNRSQMSSSFGFSQNWNSFLLSIHVIPHQTQQKLHTHLVFFQDFFSWPTVDSHLVANIYHHCLKINIGIDVIVYKEARVHLSSVLRHQFVFV